MPNSIILLAQGAQTRMPRRALPKHFLPITATESIIGRTLRQVQTRDPGAKRYVVCDRSESWLRLDPTVELVTMARARSVSERVYQTIAMWQERTTLLLGDVVFSNWALDVFWQANRLTFVGRSGPNRVTGRPHGELFGFVITNNADRVAMLDALRSSLWEGAPGRLWDLLATFTYDDPLVDLGPDDYTDDVDFDEDIDVALPRLQEAAAADDASVT